MIAAMLLYRKRLRKSYWINIYKRQKTCFSHFTEIIQSTKTTITWRKTIMSRSLPNSPYQSTATFPSCDLHHLHRRKPHVLVAISSSIDSVRKYIPLNRIFLCLLLVRLYRSFFIKMLFVDSFASDTHLSVWIVISSSRDCCN